MIHLAYEVKLRRLERIIVLGIKHGSRSHRDVNTQTELQSLIRGIIRTLEFHDPSLDVVVLQSSVITALRIAVDVRKLLVQSFDEGGFQHISFSGKLIIKRRIETEGCGGRRIQFRVSKTPTVIVIDMLFKNTVY